MRTFSHPEEDWFRGRLIDILKEKMEVNKIHIGIMLNRNVIILKMNELGTNFISKTR